MFESLRIDSLSYSYSENNKILNGIYLEANKSEIIGILGRNGSGKTTFFNSLTIFDNFTGSIFINDNYISMKAFSKIVAYLPQVPFLPNEKKVKYVLN